MNRTEALDRGRESFGRQAWGDAYAQLWAAHQEAPLDLEDLERLATAARLVGRDGDSADVWARAHHEYLRRSDAAANGIQGAGHVLSRPSTSPGGSPAGRPSRQGQRQG